MDVSCPSCTARYTADDEKLRGKTARMRCKACDAVWLVSGPSAAETTPARPTLNEEKRAAVVKKGAERDKRDLFAARDPDEGSIKQTLRPAPFVSSGVGARNETSVLFRVDQLVAAGRLKTPEPKPAPVIESRAAAPAIGDDEGVIDLKALSSAPPPKIGLPVAPLFSEPPGGISLDITRSGQHPVAKPANRFRLMGGLAAAAAFLLVAGLGLSLAFKGEEPVKHAAALAAPPPPPAETTPPKVDPAPPVTVATTDDAKDEAPVKETKTKKGKGGKSKAAKSGTAKAQAVAKPAPKPANPCGCNGDFNCIIACTAKGGK